MITARSPYPLNFDGDSGIVLRIDLQNICYDPVIEPSQQNISNEELRPMF